jgi:hypothetical protein
MLDVVGERKPRFVPAQVIAEFTQLAARSIWGLIRRLRRSRVHVEADLPKRAESWRMRFMAPRASGVEEDTPFSYPQPSSASTLQARDGQL